MAYRGPKEYRVESGDSSVKRSFRKLSAAKKFAKSTADRLGKKVYIDELWDVGQVRDWTIEPYIPASRIGGEHNPKQLLFRTKAAALKYAREHGAKKFSVRKLKRGRA